ncbi:unnamed protein product [Citrullus colocynthis]|uniref:Uncharacterized protein n=1 Tax=Citrullus colocynthis TaxID=252529 RepID=A0ABP0XPX7_9ROSI
MNFIVGQNDVSAFGNGWILSPFRIKKPTRESNFFSPKQHLQFKQRHNGVTEPNVLIIREFAFDREGQLLSCVQELFGADLFNSFT